MPITEQQLAEEIEAAFNNDSDKVVNPAEARNRQAKAIAAAIFKSMIGRTTIVTGTSATGGAVTGEGIIQV